MHIYMCQCQWHSCDNVEHSVAASLGPLEPGCSRVEIMSLHSAKTRAADKRLEEKAVEA